MTYVCDVFAISDFTMTVEATQVNCNCRVYVSLTKLSEGTFATTLKLYVPV